MQNFDYNFLLIILSYTLDVLCVYFIFYQAYKFLKDSLAAQMFRSFFYFFVLTIIASFLKFIVVEWLFRTMWTVSIVVIAVIFQPEIRKLLVEIGKKRIGSVKIDEDSQIKIISALKFFSEKKIGALIILERNVSLKNFIDSGVKLNSLISLEILKTIFAPTSPLHDGAVVIQKNKLASAASLLPLSKQELDKTIGTRHRAGLGLSEVSDAFVFIVSEETGNFSFCANGKIYWNVKLKRIGYILQKFYGKTREKNTKRLFSRLRYFFSFSMLKRNFKEKAVCFVLAIIFWSYVKLVILH